MVSGIASIRRAILGGVYTWEILGNVVFVISIAFDVVCQGEEETQYLLLLYIARRIRIDARFEL